MRTIGAGFVALKGSLREVVAQFDFCVERQNLTMRMSMRRFTRLTNAFSKEIENHAHSVALHFMHYNFCRIHQTLGVTPAMEAGVTERLWEVSDIVKLVEEAAPKPKKPGPARPKARSMARESQTEPLPFGNKMWFLACSPVGLRFR